MARRFYFLLLCFVLVTFAHGDCLADQERYDKKFHMFYPICKSDCNEERSMYNANFDELFPQCKPSKDSEIKPSTVNLGTISSNDKIVKRRRLVQRYSTCSITSNGDYSLSANCSITPASAITVGSGDTLKITGVPDSIDAKPAIDGGWDGLFGSSDGYTVLRVNTGGRLVVDNIIVTSGNSMKGGGIYVGGGNVAISNSEVSSNSASDGGAIYMTGGSLTISNSIVSGNKGEYCGGIHITGGVVIISNTEISGNLIGVCITGGVVTLSSSIITGNNFSNQWSFSGGIYLSYGSAIITDTVFTHNIGQMVSIFSLKMI